MRRREFLGSLLGGVVAAWPLAAHAQQSAHVPRIGYLGFGSAAASAGRVAALREGLRDLGYTEGKNIEIEFRWAERVDQLPDFAAELVGMNVDVIVANSSLLVEPALKATKTIPIVFCVHADPVGTGHVASLPHPGGNVTGLSMLLTDLVAKELEIFTEAIPGMTRIGVLWNPAVPTVQLSLRMAKSAGEKLGVRIIDVPAQTVDDFEGAFSTMSEARVAGVHVVASPLFTSQRVRVAELALKHRLPSMFGTKLEVEAGGLMSYGADLDDLFRRAALYIDKILKGTKPADLPVEQASRYELVINLKTAKVLDLTISPTLLSRADEVIE
jgi:putative tryptophan/tyrosine transport system substrate-binding protein